MNNQQFNNQSQNGSSSVRASARFLMSQSRQKEQLRQQTMLQRAASEIGIDE